MTQACTRCGETKPVSDFGLQAARADGRQPPRGICKTCDHARIAANRRVKRAADPEWAQRQRDRGRDERRWLRYGMTETEYRAALVRQDGQCAICGRHQSQFKRRLAVDHDHETGALRELLCSPCNTALGLVDENVDRLIALAMYLIKHKEMTNA